MRGYLRLIPTHREGTSEYIISVLGTVDKLTGFSRQAASIAIQCKKVMMSKVFFTKFLTSDAACSAQLVYS